MVAARAAWPTEGETGVGGIAPARLVFLDECGVLTNMARLRGRSPRGTRAYGMVPFGHWTRLTVLGALGTGGMVAAMATEAATSGAVFLAYLEQVPLPELRRAAARTAEALHQALGPAVDTITAQDATGFFRHAGYGRPS